MYNLANCFLKIKGDVDIRDCKVIIFHNAQIIFYVVGGCQSLRTQLNLIPAKFHAPSFLGFHRNSDENALNERRGI